MAQPSLSLTRRLQAVLPQEARKWIFIFLLTGMLGAATFTWAMKMWTFRLPARLRKRSATSTDPGLLVKGTRFESYQIPSGHVYPKIRTFYHEHPQKKKLPTDLPLLVFMHGLGGSVAQFAPLLTSLVNVAPCLAIDLPGCGRSEFQPRDTRAYTTTAFGELLFAAIDRFRDKEVNQKIVLVGHSMGCSIAALLASSNSPLAHLCSRDIVGMIALCPRSTTLSEQDLLGIQRLNRIWSPIFDLIRLFDRRGGVNSVSVMRVVGKDADHETKKLQLRFNEQSRSDVFQKVLLGIYLQEKETAEKGEESLLGRRIWSGLKKSLYLVAAEDDKLAPPKEVQQIAEWLKTDERHDSKADSVLPADQNGSRSNDMEGIAPDQLAPVQISQADPGESDLPAVAGDADLVENRLFKTDGSQLTDQETGGPESTAVTEKETSTKHAFALKTTTFPAPAAHGLLYATKDVRVLSSLIEKFLAKHVDHRLSPGWQLQHLTTSGKWDVKNLEKWKKIDPCSEPIGGIFRAMKTMREVDEVHTPKVFAKKYSWEVVPDGVALIVDISHDVPVYNKSSLEAENIEYHKFPTVSKQPPTEDEVEHFNDLIDSLRRSPKIAGVEEGKRRPTVGVHCHYGFNRTGFFIVSYLVQQEKWKLEDALAEFAAKRPPGIKHSHFIDDLYARYATKIERRATIVG